MKAVLKVKEEIWGSSTKLLEENPYREETVQIIDRRQYSLSGFQVEDPKSRFKEELVFVSARITISINVWKY